MKSLLLSLVIVLFPLSVVADCVVAKDGDGKYTHICSDYKADSFEVPGHVGDQLMGPQESVSRPYYYGRDDTYMSDFSDDTLRENMDFGADDDPGIGADIGSDYGSDF